MNSLLAKKWTPFLLLGIATLLVWGHTVTFGFVWDDDFFIRDLQSVRSLHNIPEMFYRLDAQATLPDFVVFRPIRTAHYALLHFLGGQEIPQPWIYHLANVLWHGGTAMMLFAAMALLLPRLCKNLSAGETRLWSFWIALAFAVHPVVSEVVCWAKSLDDILATFFTLAAFRELLLPPENKSARWRSLIFFALAVYSKESAVPFAMIPMVVYYNVHRLSWKENFVRTAAFFVIALIYLAHRHLVIGRSSQTSPISGTYGQTLVDMLPVIPKYARLFFGIPPFCIDYSYLHGGHPLLSFGVLSGLALFLTLVVIGFLAWRKPGFELVGFGLLWASLFLLPVSNLVPMMQYMAERFLYLPLIGWLIALAAIFSNLPRQPVLRAGAFAILFLWALTAWNRSWIWQDRVTLFVRSSQENPKTQRVEDNAVAAILELPPIQHLFAHDEGNKQFYATISTNTTVNQNALETLEAACRLFPTNSNLLSYYGMSLAICGQPEKALPFLDQAAKLKPDSLVRWLNLARAALSAGLPALAEPALEKASFLSRTNPAVLQLQFNFYWQTADYIAAHKTILQLNQIAPSNDNAYWLSNVMAKISSTISTNQPATSPPIIK
jgi:protein O-mannosyl-transferase